MKHVYLSLIVSFSFFTVLFSQEVRFENGMWEWVTGSKISDKRLNEIAPHFPRPEQYSFDLKLYDQAIYKWQKLYCYEYENFVNAPELTALNPYYTGYVDVIQLPYFLGALESYEKPLRKDTGNQFEDDLAFELAVQNWYFVFHPDEFQQKYKMKLDFPDWFNPEEYRQKIIKKIEDNKNVDPNKSSN